ncbi:MAG: hypothetical protein GWP14_05005 [Actinobacteria bacterium]|nr:hypothetical protein [Actinomycetota bacterium]
MKIKAAVIALLLVVNIGLLAAVIFGVAGGSTAYAQAMPGSPKYLMVTGRFRQTEQALYVVNLEKRMLAVFTFDQGSKRLTYKDRASLVADFR